MSCTPDILVRYPLLPGYTFVDQGLAVGDEGFDLRLYVVANLLLLGLQSLKLSNYVALHSDRGQRDTNEAKLLVTKPLLRRTCERREDLPLAHR